MLKFIIACALLCITLPEAIASTDLKFSIKADYSTTVLIRNEFYIFSKNEDHLRIDSNKEYYQCEIPISNVQEHFIHSDIQAKYLGNSLVVLWGTNKESRHDAFGKIERIKTDYIVMIIDVLYCESKILPIFRDFTDSKPKNKPIVITYKDEFDVFLPSLEECNPCRFDHRGNRIHLENQLPAIPHDLYHMTYQIDAVFDEDSNLYGYFFAYNLNDEDIALQVLHDNFTILSEDFLYGLESPKVIISTNYGSYPALGICYEKIDDDRTSTICECRNGLLELQNRIALPTHPYLNLIRNLKIDFSGNFYLAVAEKSSITAKYMDVILKRVNEDGKVDILAENEAISFPAMYPEMQSFVVNNDEKFCVSMSYREISFSNPDDTFVHTEIKCFDTSKGE